MWQINIDSLQLKASEELNPYDVRYPIVWSGLYENEKVEIVQNSPVSSFVESYSFLVFPEKFNTSKKKIISIIDRYLKTRLE